MGRGVDDSQRLSVEKVLETLRADYVRQEGLLVLSRVEFLIERHGLEPEACAEVYRGLAVSNIHVADDDEVPSDRPPSNQLGRSAPMDRLVGHRLLGRTEEVELFRRYSLGRRMADAVDAGSVEPNCHARRIIDLGREAERNLVEGNMRLVVSIARRYMRYSSLSLDDLVQEGAMGLMHAVELFDHTRELKLSTYATWWIRQAVTRAIADRGSTIRFPVHVAEDMLKLRRTEDRLLATHGRKATSEELATDLEWSRRRLSRVRRAARVGVVSLDAALDAGGEGAGLIAIMPSPDPTPEEVMIQKALADRLEESLREFMPRTAAILRRRFGLDTGGEETLEQIGQSYNVTRERIRQIEAKGLQALKHPRHSRPLRPFIEG